MASAILNNLTSDQVRRLLDYDQNTGVFSWRVKVASKTVIGAPAGRLATGGYWRIGVLGKVYAAHRLAWLYVYGEWPTKDIDHINGNRCDNRIGNLRDVSRSVNMQNLRAARVDNLSSGLLGVSLFKKNGTYTAHIQVGKKQKNLGYFDTPESAHEAYIQAKRRLHEGCTL